MKRFKDNNRDQGLFLTINIHNQLLPGMLEYTVDYLLENRVPPLIILKIFLKFFSWLILEVSLPSGRLNASVRKISHLWRSAERKVRITPQSGGLSTGCNLLSFLFFSNYSCTEKKDRNPRRTGKDLFKHEMFTFDPERNLYICPAGKLLRNDGKRNMHGHLGRRYVQKDGACELCHLKSKCLRKGGENRNLFVGDVP